MFIKKKIMIIEDQALLNNMMQKVLSNDYDIVCTCTSAKDMMNLYKKYTPDLILTDVVTKDGANGIDYGKEVKEKYGKKVKILAITGVPDITFLDNAKKYNLDGLIYKDIDSDSLLTSINQILNGYTLFPDNYIYNEEIDINKFNVVHNVPDDIYDTTKSFFKKNMSLIDNGAFSNKFKLAFKSQL